MSTNYEEPNIRVVSVVVEKGFASSGDFGADAPDFGWGDK